MEISPRQIYKDFSNSNLDKISAVDQLIFIIDNSEKINIRIESIEILERIGLRTDKVFNLLENLLISDSNENVRNLAANVIKTHFIEKAFAPMRWAYEHESSIKCLTTIISTVGQIKQPEATLFLFEKLQKIENYQFRKSIADILDTKNIHNHSNKKLADVINNYIVIKYFEDKFSRLNFKVERGLVTELDLSCISNNVFGISILKNLPDFIIILRKLRKLDLKINRISTLPKTIGELPNLKYLDLSNNIIKSLPEKIGQLKNLEHLYLRYNNLNNLPKSICSLESLKILDLRHNKLS